ncbi:MAG: hypothetical protein ABSE64_16005 [Vulcanimicrobiaceae bacterium]|jgi:hypothetical protein
MHDSSTFERAYEAFRSQAQITAPKLPGSELSAREERLRDLLRASGLAPRIEDGDLVTRYRGWTIVVSAPDEDPQWTALYCSVEDCGKPECRAKLDAAVNHINARIKCAQAARMDDKTIVITVGLLTDVEPSVQLLQRAYDILGGALQVLRD